MSRFLSANDVSAISDLLSGPRLGTFVGLTRSGSNSDAIELHQATMSMGIALMAVISLIEVALRNSACRELDVAFGAPGWLRQPPPNFKWAALEKHAVLKAEKQAQRSMYSKMPGAQKQALDLVAFPNGVPNGIKHRKLAEKRQATIAVPDGQVVSQLTFHFWKRLFSTDYEQKLWRRALKRVFPNKSITRAQVATELEILYEIRNRLAHHEPVYNARLTSALNAIDFVAMNLGGHSSSFENPFSKLILPQRDILAGHVAVFQATLHRLR
jgi:hypothetical protein